MPSINEQFKKVTTITIEEMAYLKMNINNILNFKIIIFRIQKKNKRFIEKSIKHSRPLNNYISIAKNKNPNKYINTDSILKNYKNINTKINSTDNPVFILSLLSKCFEKLGIKIFIATEKDKNFNKLEIASIQSLVSLVGKKKYELHFDFGKKKNEGILNDIKEKEKFLSEYKEKLSKALKIESQKLIFTDVHHGCVAANVSIIDPANENPLSNLTEGDRQNLHITRIEEKQIIENLQINVDVLDAIGDREKGFWGEGQIRGGNDYFPPINGWNGVGLKVSDEYDNGNNDWLDYENNEGEFSIAYLPIYNDLKDIPKEIMKYKEKRNIRRKNSTDDAVCGNGICLFQDPEYAENNTGYVDIIGFRFKILLMCRVNPIKIREPENCKNCWILNPTPDEVRPYRILIKKVPISEMASSNEFHEIITTNIPVSYILDSILSNDTSFFNISEAKSGNYRRIKNLGLRNEKFALKVYTSPDYKYINNYLRTKKIKVREEDEEKYNEKQLRSWTCCLNSALGHLEKNVDDNTIVYRGIDCKLPDNFREGSKFYFREFISTSQEKKVAEIYANAGTLFIIKIKNNGTNGHLNYCMDISDLSDIPDEEEILISCHCYFSVTKIKRGEEGKYDEVELDCYGKIGF